MKFFVAVGFALMLGVGYFFVGGSGESTAPDANSQAWKSTAVETETAVRPESFAAMKWSPSDPAPVEVRMPASVKPAKRKKQ